MRNLPAANLTINNFFNIEVKAAKLFDFSFSRNPRWRIQDGGCCQKIDFWTYYKPTMFRCASLNDLGILERGRNLPLPGLKRPKKPGLNRVNK